MAPLEEPTVAEMVRALMRQVDDVGSSVASMHGSLAQFVTQEQRATDKELFDLKLKAVSDDVADLEERDKHRTRALWTVGISPVIVSLVTWLWTKGAS